MLSVRREARKWVVHHQVCVEQEKRDNITDTYRLVKCLVSPLASIEHNSPVKADPEFLKRANEQCSPIEANKLSLEGEACPIRNLFVLDSFRWMYFRYGDETI